MAVSKTATQKSKAASKPDGRGVSAAARPSVPETRKDAAPSISAEERRRLVERAAYFRAEKRGFAPGCELADWVEAEAEVLRLIGSA